MARRSEVTAELNTSSMFDMGFQLLAFFILTFRPNPIEGQVSVRLPPPEAVAVRDPNAQRAGSDESNPNPIQGINTLTIGVFASGEGSGQRVTYRVGEADVGSIPALDRRLQTIFADAGNPFDQVIIQVTSNVLYEKLMEVVEVCTRQTLPSGQKLGKLSFVEVPVEPGG